jgi:hypothetical protein
VHRLHEREPVHVRHLPVGDDDVGAALVERGQRGSAVVAHLARVAGATERGGHHLGHARLVVDDEHPRRVAHAAAGRRMVKHAPPPGRSPTSMRPPCASTIWRATARPSPVPFGRVVRTARTRATAARAMPAPRSATASSIPPSAACARIDLAARRRRLDGVREEPDEHLAERPPPAWTTGRIVRLVARDVLRLQLRAGERDGARDDVADVGRSRVELERTREREERAHDAAQPVDLRDDERRRTMAVRVARRQRLAEPLGRGAHDGQRVPHLVRDRRRELSERRELLALRDARARDVERRRGHALRCRDSTSPPR